MIRHAFALLRKERFTYTPRALRVFLRMLRAADAATLMPCTPLPTLMPSMLRQDIRRCCHLRMMLRFSMMLISRHADISMLWLRFDAVTRFMRYASHDRAE